MVRRFLLVAGTVVMLASACSTAGPSEHAQEDRAPGIHLTRINRYESLQALERDSVAVVIATARGSSTATSNGFPVTITTVEVSEVVSGGMDASSFDIHQLGTAGVASHDTSALLKRDHTYLLYLSLEDAGAAKRVVITGDDGVYELRGDVYVYAGGPGGRVPVTIAADTVKPSAATRGP